jgi:glycerophosphoryl diester phosphodiesterase
VPDLASLEDVLARFAEQAFLDIELKVPGSEVDVVAALRRFRPKIGFVVSSFLPEVLHDVTRADPNIPLGLICDRLSQLNYWPEVSIDYVIPHFALLTRPLLEKLHAAEKKVVVWTVNKPDEMLRYAEWGVDGIVSDIPELLVRTLKKNGR